LGEVAGAEEGGGEGGGEGEGEVVAASGFAEGEVGVPG